MMADVRRRNGKKSSNLSTESQTDKNDKTSAWDYIFPILVGILCAAALIIVYMAVFSSHSSTSHNEKLVSNLEDAHQDNGLGLDDARDKVRDMKHSPFFNQLSNKDNGNGNGINNIPPQNVDGLPGNNRPNNILRDLDRFKQPYRNDDGDVDGNLEQFREANKYAKRMSRLRPGDKLLGGRNGNGFGDPNNPDDVRNARDAFLANGMDPRMRKRSRREKFERKFGNRYADYNDINNNDIVGGGVDLLDRDSNTNNNIPDQLNLNNGLDGGANTQDDADQFGQYADQRGRFGTDDIRGSRMDRMDRRDGRYEDMMRMGRDRRDRRDRDRDRRHGRDRDNFMDRGGRGGDIMNEMRGGRRERDRGSRGDRGGRYSDMLRGGMRSDDNNGGGYSGGINDGPFVGDDRMGGNSAARIRDQIRDGMNGNGNNGGMVNDDDLREYSNRKKQELRDRLNSINNNNNNGGGGAGNDQGAQLY